MKNFESIYQTMLGLLEEEYCVPGVEDAFAPGSLCAREYEAMREAYDRVCRRLGKEEDRDLDEMVYALEQIQEELCRRFYNLHL